MNPLLRLLQPYPFERLRQLHATVTPNPALRPISLGIGEPRHATPPLIEQALVSHLSGLSSYPATAGEPALKAAMAGWLQSRYGLSVDAGRQVLVNMGAPAPENLGRTERLLELVGTDSADVQAGRQRWRQYQARGFEILPYDRKGRD